MLWLLPVVNTIAVISTCGTLVYLAISTYFFRRAKRLMPELPYPEGYWPLIGHLLVFSEAATGTKELWSRLSNYAEYYSDGFYGIVGHIVWIFMVDQDVMQEVLSSQETIEKSFIYTKLDCITDGVFIAPGLRWRKLRKRLNLTFSAKQIDSYMDAVNHHSEVYLNVVLKKLQQSNKYTDIQPYIARFFFDVMAKTHFGNDTEEQVKQEYQVPEAASKVIELLLESRFLKPILHNDFLFQLTGLFKVIDGIRSKPLQYIETLVENRLNTPPEEKALNENIVYVDMVSEALKSMNIPPTIYNIQRNSGDLLIAGSDTTSITASTLLYFLAINKDVQEKVYDEVSKIYGQESYKPLTKQDIASMTYLEMTMNEALRWSAPPGILRQFHKDFDVGKYTMPKGANTYIMITPQHFNPKFYERVNDFYPEHFSPDAVKNRPKMAFVPFSSGPRNCPGKVFAYVLIKAATSVVVNNYYIESNLPVDQVDRKMILMTQHVQGYPIRFIPRQHHTHRG